MKDTLRIRTADAVLHADLYGQHLGSPAVIFVHGLGGCRASWGALPTILGESRPTVVVELRGCGRSERGTEDMTLLRLADDLLAVVHALGDAKVHFVGHSLGGVIVQQFLVNHSSRCRAAVLISTSSIVGEQSTRNWRKLADMVEARGEVGDGGSARGFAETFAATHPEVIAEHGAIAARCAARVYAEQARAASSYDFTEQLRRVDTPVLVLQGLADRLTSPGGSVILDRALPNSRLSLMEGVGHNLHVEATAEVAATIRDFLDSHDD